MNTINKILAKIGAEGNRSWYVGITDNPERRLFGEHNVDKSLSSCWFYENVFSEMEARGIEKHLINVYQFKGGTGGGFCPTYVYAYRITATTRQ